MVDEIKLLEEAIYLVAESAHIGYVPRLQEIFDILTHQNEISDGLKARTDGSESETIVNTVFPINKPSEVWVMDEYEWAENIIEVNKKNKFNNIFIRHLSNDTIQKLRKKYIVIAGNFVSSKDNEAYSGHIICW